MIAACWLFRDSLEADPVTHVLLQLPLLALAGGMGACALINRRRQSGWAWTRGSLALILAAIFTMAFWMLPRSIDAALVDDWMELAKFVTVPGLIGAPLAIGWPKAHPLLRGFLKAQAVSMLGVMAFLYTHAPIRICNAYLVADQERLGFGFLLAAVVCAVLWTMPIFLDREQPHPSQRQAAAS